MTSFSCRSLCMMAPHAAHFEACCDVDHLVLVLLWNRRIECPQASFLLEVRQEMGRQLALAASPSPE